MAAISAAYCAGVDDDHGQLQALARGAHGHRHGGGAPDARYPGDVALGRRGDARPDLGRGDQGVGPRGRPGRGHVGAGHGAAGHGRERDHGEREDQRERGQQAGLGGGPAPGEADDQHHPAAPAAEPGEPAQPDRVRPHDQQRDGDGGEHRGRAGEQVDLAGRGQPLLPEQDQAAGGRADQRAVGHPAPRRGDPAAGGRAGSGVARRGGCGTTTRPAPEGRPARWR